VALTVWLTALASATGQPTNVWTAGSFNDSDPSNNNHRWDNPANWEPYGVPDTNAVVIINSGQPDAAALGAFRQHTVYLNGGTLNTAGLVIERLYQNGGSLSGSNAIAEAGGIWEWNAGWVHGNCRVLAGATLTISGSGEKRLGDGARLDVEGTMNWFGPQPLVGWCWGAPATLNVHSNSVLVLGGSGTVFGRYYGYYPFNVVVAAGAVMRQGAGLTNSITSVTWDVSGQVELGGGQLEVGTMVTMRDGARCVGAGLVRQTGGEVHWPGRVVLDGVDWEQVDGSLIGDGAGGVVETANGAGLRWLGGWWQGTLTLTNGVEALWAGGEKRLGDGAVVHNHGVIRWTGGLVRAWCYLAPATLNVHSNSVLVLGGSGTVFGRYYGYYPFNVVVAAGAVMRQGAGLTNSITSVTWDVSGQVELGGGQLEVGTMVTMRDGARCVGAGLVRQTGGEVHWPGRVVLDGVDWEQVDGSLIGDGAGGVVETANGAGLRWLGGWWQGTLTLTNGVEALWAGGEKRLGDGAVVHNHGVIRWTGGLVRAWCYLAPATCHNHPSGTWIVQAADGLLRVYSSYSASVVNDGLVILGAPGAFVSSTWRFTQNAGGTLALQLAGTNTPAQFGRWQADQWADVAGALRVTLSGDFSPQPGDTFEFLAASPLALRVAELQLPDLPPGQAWVLDATSARATLRIEATGACAERPPGLFAWWPGDGHSGDSAGVLHGSLANGAAYAGSKVGLGFWFDGADDRLETPQPGVEILTNEFTIEFWARPTAGRNGTAEVNSGVLGAGGQRYAVFPSWGGETGGAGLGVSVGTNGVSVFEHAANHLPSLLVADVPITNWTHIAVVVQSNQPSLYLNGEFVRSGLPSGKSWLFASGQFGDKPGGPSYGAYAGGLDEIRIYSRALTTNEIAALAAAGAAGLCSTQSFRPDLVVADLHVEGPNTNGSYQILWSTCNRGAGAASAGFHERVQVRNLASGAFVLNAGRIVPVALAPGQGVTNSAWLTPREPGRLEVVVTTDSDNQLYEFDGTNHWTAELNTATLEFDPVIYWPDLVAGELAAPASAQTLQTIPVTWTVTNTGWGAALADWHDRLYLSADAVLDAADMPLGDFLRVEALAAGEAYTQTQAVTLPNVPPGEYHLLLLADALGHETELSESNNTAVGGPLVLTLSPMPDLAVADVQAPTNAVVGGALEVRWTVVNQGNALARGPWRERVLLRPDALGAPPVVLTELRCDDLLPVGTPTVRTQVVTLPPATAAGNLWLGIETDSAGHVPEQIETNNVSFAALPTVAQARLNLELAVSEIAEDAQPPGFQVSVWRNGDLAVPLVVQLSNSHPAELQIPASLTIASNQAAASFTAQVLRDGVVDGPQTVTLWAVASNYLWGIGMVRVLDADKPVLALGLATHWVGEGGTVAASVTRDLVTTQAVAVQLTCNVPGQVVASGPIVIPADQPGVTVTLTALDDTLIELTNTYTLTVSATGFVSGSGALTVADNDWPEVEVTATAATVTENAGPCATRLEVRRNPVTDQPVTVELVNSAPGAATVPARVTIPAGSAVASVWFGAVDNGIVDGSKLVQVTPWLLLPDTGQRLRQGAPVSVTITDDEGPTLRLVLAQTLAAEGLTPATMATVYRNTTNAEPVLVTLASSDTGEATVPPSVTIPADQMSASFPVNTIQDSVGDGNQPVTLTASASGYNSGVATLVVSDVDFPDLVVRSVTVPSNAVSAQLFSVAFRVANQGTARAEGGWVQSVYVSDDPWLDSRDRLLGQFSYGGALDPGQHFDQTVSVYAPRQPTNYYVLVATDTSQRVAETLEDNNVTAAAAPVRVQAPFTATVAADLESAPAGTPVPLRGHATRLDGTPAAFELVHIQVTLRGTKRLLATVADAQGDFTAVFRPLRNEGGLYQVSAGAPYVEGLPPQDEFTLLGCVAEPAKVALDLAALGTVSGEVTLANLSEYPLTGLSCAVIGAVNLDVQVALTNQLAGNAAAPLRFTVTSVANEAAQTTFALRLTSAEGATLDVPIRATVTPLVAELQANPRELRAGMVRGELRTVQVELVNRGGAESGPMEVLLPAVGWMRLVTPNPLPSLLPGQTNVLVLALQPGPDVPLAPFDGTIAVNAEHTTLTLPFHIRNLSAAVGELRLVAVDEMAYQSDGPTNLAGAIVELRDPYTGAVVCSGETDASGECVVTNLMEGTYNLEVSAPRHDRATGTLTIVPGQRVEKRVFLRTQFVQYRWTVEEIEIEDRTRIVLETTYEAYVPAPVVTVEPNLIDLDTVQGNETQVDLKITNHGLIAAQNVSLGFESHPLWTITPLVREVDSLPAQSSLTIPVIIRRVGASPAPQPGRGGVVSAAGADADDPPPRPEMEGGFAPCRINAQVKYIWVCGGRGIAYPVPILVLNASHDCDPVVTPEPTPTTPPPPNIEPPPAGFFVEPGGLPQTQVLLPDTPQGEVWGGPVQWDEFVPIHYTTSWGGGSGSTTLAAGSPSYSPPSTCACDATNFVEECYTVEKEIDLEQVGDILTKALKPLLPPWLKLEDVSVSVTPEGGLCTCCRDGIRSIKGHAGAQLDVTLTLRGGFNAETPMAPVNVPGLGTVDMGVEVFIGVEGDLYGQVGATLDTGCGSLKGSQLCLNGMLGLALRPTALGEAKFKMGDDDLGSTSAKAFVEFRCEFHVEKCSDQPTKAYFKILPVFGEVSAGGKLGDHDVAVSARHTFWEGDCWSLTGDGCDDAAPGVSAASAPADGATVSVPTAAGTASPARRKTFEYVARPPRPANPPPLAASGSDNDNPPPDSGVCAQVRLRIEQEAVLTRKAVGATLEMDNTSATVPIEDIEVALQIYAPDGSVANDRFVILPAQLTRFERVGDAGSETNWVYLPHETWRLPPSRTGRARWVILPKDEAATNTPVVYRVGGAFTYTFGGVAGGATLFPAPVNVYPNPRLALTYFHERDVRSDDPFTPEVEPAVPYSLAVMARNIGAGVARNFSIASAQPRIVDNEKGLLIDFEILASEVAGQPITPSLTVNFGDLQPGQIKIARWLLRSSLMGFFADYQASFEHEPRFGGRDACLVDSVEIHEMIHLVRALGAWDDGQPDFLVNDVKDDQNLPETLYLSDGTVSNVTAVLSATPLATPSTNRLTIPLTAPMPAGWAYLRVPDPADGTLRLVRVVRSDGQEIPVGVNAWTTDRTFRGVGQRPVRENLLHLLDCDSTGFYSLTYEIVPPPDTTPPQSAVAALPAQSPSRIHVQWSGSDAGSGIASYDVFISANGSPFVPWLQKTRLTGAVYEGLLGVQYAFYSVATDNAGNQESPPTAPDAVTLVSVTNRPPVITPPADQEVDEGGEFVLQPVVTDDDLPNDRLTFSLLSAPAGLTLDPATGRMRWLTGEANGPSTNTVTWRVQDNGLPPASATNAFRLVVREVNTPPVLAPVTNLTVLEGRWLTVTNAATDTDLPAQRLTWSLLEAPAGASLDAASGLLRWKPTEFQGGATYRFTVAVGDDGPGRLTATQTFQVTVLDVLSDFSVGPETTNLLAGQSSFVPLTLVAGTPLTNVAFTLTLDRAGLDGLVLEPRAPGLGGSSLEPTATNQYRVTFATAPGAFLQGTQELARLHFSTAPGCGSAVVGVRAQAVSGRGTDGSRYDHGGGGGGRVFVIGEQPILADLTRSGSTAGLTLYGQPGRRYAIEKRAGLTGGGWETLRLVALGGTSSNLVGLAAAETQGFYRAVEAAAAGPLSIRAEGGQFVIEWQPTRPNCTLEQSPALGAAQLWTPVPDAVVELTNGVARVTLAPSAGTRFYRLRCD